MKITRDKDGKVTTGDVEFAVPKDKSMLSVLGGPNKIEDGDVFSEEESENPSSSLWSMVEPITSVTGNPNMRIAGK